MTPGKEIFELVNSLNASEKRYFKIYLGSSGGRKADLCIQLFDLANRHPEQDETWLKEKLRMDGKKFARMKHYFTGLLLRSLQAFHYEASVSKRLRSSLDKIELLYKKGLTGFAIKEVEKAELLAEQYQELKLLASIFHWKRLLLKAVSGKSLEKQLKALTIAERQLGERLEEEFKWSGIHDRLLIFLRQSSLETADLPPDLEREIQQQHPPEASFNTRLWYLLSLAFYQKVRKAPHGIAAAYQEALKHWEAYPHILREHPQRYYNAVKASLFASHSIGDYRAYESMLEKLKSEPAPEKAMQQEMMFVIYNLKLIYNMNQGQWAEAESMETEVMDLMNRRKAQPPTSSYISLCTNVGILKFLIEDFSAAGKWFRKITDMPRTEVRRDLQELSRLLNLIVLQELGDDMLIPYQIRAYRRSVSKRRALSSFEMVLFDYFLQSEANPGPANRLSLRKALYQKLEAFPQEDRKSGFAEIITWLNSRINNISILKAHFKTSS